MNEARTLPPWELLESLEHLTPEERELLPVPDSAQVSLNLSSMANFWPLLKPLLDAARPARICEIGCDLGMNTRVLADYCRENNAELVVVDPQPAAEDIETLGSHVRLARTTSHEYLRTGPPADVYFVDGDHNYFTVSEELRLIADHLERGCSPLLLLHDVGWPCGRRDMYYRPERIPQPLPYEFGRHLRPAAAVPPEVGIRFGVGVALREGGERNGVLTAVEEFLRDRPEWTFFWLPVVYGLGVLWPRSGVSSAAAHELERLRDLADRIRPFLATLELNRLLLLAKVEHDGILWKRQQEEIQRLGTSLEEAKKALAERSAELEQASAQLDQASAALEESARAMAAVYRSLSWRLTRPLRAFASWMGRTLR